MKKIASLLIVSLMCSGFFTQAQKIDINWSKKQMYDNNFDGFFAGFIGTNSKYVYAYYSKLRATGRHKTKDKLKIVSFDKTSMQRIADAPVTGFPQNEAEMINYKDLYYYKTVVFEKIVYLFWLKDKNDKAQTRELYVQSFDEKLNKLKPLKKIYEVASGDKSNNSSSIFLMANKKSNEQIVVGAELVANKGESVKFEYKVLNSDFTFSSANQVELPIKVTGKSRGLSSTYTFGDDGNIYVKTYVRVEKEELKNAKKNKETIVTSYPILTLVDVSSGKYSTQTIKADNKSIFDFDFIAGATSIKIFGFFCDFLKDPKGNDTHGIFSGTIDNKTFEVSNLNFSYFTKTQLDQLFAKDQGDRKDKHFIESKKKAKSENESIASNYEIENVQSIDNNNIVLFCSRMRNYTVTYYNSKGGSQSVPYCDKSNVTAFKVDNDGKIVWASNLDRFITYGGWNISDVNVINKDGKFYAIYGAGKIKTDKTVKRPPNFERDNFEYAVFDYETGKFSKETCQVNGPRTPKQEIKNNISATGIYKFDNTFYVNSTSISHKPGPTAAWCAASLVCPYLLTVVFLNPNLKQGIGYMGTIVPAK